MIEGPVTWPTARAAPSPDGAAGSERLRLQLQNAFADCYRVGQLIGRGLCSATFRGTRVDSGDAVALKVLDFDPGMDPTLLTQVMSEFSLPEALADTCSLVPRRHEQRGSLVVIVMPYLSGGSAATLLQASAPPPLNRVQEIVGGVATSLECLHRQGTAHLGLTPGNILFDSRGRPNIADVGITNAMLQAPRVHGSRSSRASAYAAPEQRRAQKVDGRADQYALAVIAYELLTGHKRVEEETVQGIHTLAPIEIATDVPLRPGYPIFLNMVLRRALSAGAENRFPTITEFADALAGRARDSVHGLPTARAHFRLTRRRRIAGTFGALVTICAVVIIASPATRVAIRNAWRAVTGQLSWSHKLNVTVDPLASSAPVPEKSARAVRPAAGNGAPVGAAPHRSGATQPAPSHDPGRTLPSSTLSTGSTPVDIRLGASTPDGASLPKLPGASTTAAGGVSMWRSARAWFERKFGQSSSATASGTAYIHVSVDRGTTLVSVDGIPRGSAPTTISVSPGHHVVAVTGALSYRASPAGVNASAGDTSSISFQSVP